LSTPSQSSVVAPATEVHTGAPVVALQSVTRPTAHWPTALGTAHGVPSITVHPTLHFIWLLSNCSPGQHSPTFAAESPATRQAAHTLLMMRRLAPQHTRVSDAPAPSATQVWQVLLWHVSPSQHCPTTSMLHALVEPRQHRKSAPDAVQAEPEAEVQHA